MLAKIKKIPGALVRRVKILQEKMNGLDFTKSHTAEDLNMPKEIAKMYAPTLKHDFHLIMNHLKIKPTDAILDYGVGKGAAVAMMSEYPFRLVSGVDISKELIDICEKNIKTLGIKNIELFTHDAGEFKEIDDYTHFYLFNPFPGNVVKRVLNNIAKSCERNPRKITFIYYCARHRDVVDEHSYFHEVDELEGKYWKTIFYSNIK